MEPFPRVTSLDEQPDATGEGHLWLLEHVEGQPLRFQLQADGRLVFADPERAREREQVPPAVRPAIDHVERQFRRDALREAVDDVETLTFFGVATCQQRVDYDWGRLPAFVGTDIHSVERGGLLAPDAIEQSFERLGLAVAPAVVKEQRADAFQPARYDFPDSAYADGPVAGVRAIDRHGWRGLLSNAAIEPADTPSIADAEAAAERFVTEALRERATGGDRVERARDEIARRHAADLDAAGIDPDSRAFRSAVAQVLTRGD